MLKPWFPGWSSYANSQRDAEEFESARHRCRSDYIRVAEEETEIRQNVVV